MHVVTEFFKDLQDGWREYLPGALYPAEGAAMPDEGRLAMLASSHNVRKRPVIVKLQPEVARLIEAGKAALDMPAAKPPPSAADDGAAMPATAVLGDEVADMVKDKTTAAILYAQANSGKADSAEAAPPAAENTAAAPAAKPAASKKGGKAKPAAGTAT